MCNSCPSLPKSLQSDSRFDPRARSGSVAPVPARGVHAVPEGPPAASDGPVGIGSDLGITTCTPPTAASVAIQPRLLPGARPVSHALARAYWTTRLSINCKAARPPPALDQWADRYAQLERRHTLTRMHPPHARTHARLHALLHKLGFKRTRVSNKKQVSVGERLRIQLHWTSDLSQSGD